MQYPFLATGVNITQTALNQITYVLDRQLSLNSVVNTLTETAHYSVTIAGGVLETTRGLHIQFIGDLLNNSGSTASLRLRAKYGATTFFDGSALTIQNGVNRGFSIFDAVIQNFGSTGNQRAMGQWTLNGTNTGGVSGLTPNRTFGAGGSNVIQDSGQSLFSVHTSVAEDSTVNKTLAITMTLGAANASLDHRTHVVLVSLI